MSADLASQWYNAVCRGCCLDPRTFQLTQGSMPVGNTSEDLWKIFDAIPPPSLNRLYDPAQGNLFSAGYGAIIMALGAANPSPVVGAALAAWNQAGGFTAAKAYNSTIASLNTKLTSARSFTFPFDPAHEPADVSRTWAGGKVGPIPPLFRAGPRRAPTSPAMGDPAASVQTVQVTFQRLLTFVAGPLSSKSTLETDLQNYQPWYISAALQFAYRNREAWPAGQWETYFGHQGSLERCCTSLVVVDGVTTVTTLAQPAREAARGALDASATPPAFWPLALKLGAPAPTPLMALADGRSASPESTHAAPAAEPLMTVEDGGRAVRMESKLGNPFILGVNVLALPAYLGVRDETPSGAILVKNTGWFVARFSLHYEYNGRATGDQSDTFTRGTAQRLCIPAGAGKITVKIEEEYLINRWSTVASFAFADPVTKCYEVSGTTLDAHCREVPCDS